MRITKMKETSRMLVLVLAFIAAIVAVGLIEGYKMYAWIVSYWLVLTMKNLIDYISLDFKEETNDERGSACEGYARMDGSGEDDQPGYLHGVSGSGDPEPADGDVVR